MRRREFLAASAGLAGSLVPAIGGTKPCPPRTTNLTGGGSSVSNCGLNPEADWAARSTAAGVVMATDFRTPSDVTNWIFPSSAKANVSRYTGDSITGGACLRIDTPAQQDANNAAWVHPLNNAWTTDGQGFGTTPWYLQVRLKLPASRFTSGSNGGGFKLFNIGECRPQSFGNSRSHPNGEIVSGASGGYGFIAGFYRDVDYSQPGFMVPWNGSSGDQNFQPALDNGAGLPDDQRYCIWSGYPTAHVTPGCFRYPADEWFTIYLEVHIVGYGSNNKSPQNRLALTVKRDGRAPQPLWDASDFEIGADPALPLGNNGLHLLSYDTGRTVGTMDTYHLYGQVIVSTQPIAWPE